MIRWNCLTNLAHEQPRISCFHFPIYCFQISCTKVFSEQCLRPHEEFRSVQGTTLKQLWEASSLWSNKWLTLFKNRPENSFSPSVSGSVIQAVCNRLQNSPEISCIRCLQQQSWDQLRKVFATVVLRSAAQGVRNSSLEISWAECLQQQSQDQSSKVFVAVVSRSVIYSVCSSSLKIRHPRCFQIARMSFSRWPVDLTRVLV